MISIKQIGEHFPKWTNPLPPWFYLPKKTVVVEFKQWDWIEVTMTNHPLPRWEKFLNFLFLIKGHMIFWLYFDLIIHLILKVTWLSHGMFKSSCNISVEYFPFDIQVISKFQFYFVICKVIFLSTCWIWYSNNETWNCRMFRKSWFGQNDTNVWSYQIGICWIFCKTGLWDEMGFLDLRRILGEFHNATVQQCHNPTNVHFHFPSYNNRQKVLSSMCRYGRRSKNILSQYFVQPLLTDYWHLQQTFKRLCSMIWTIFIYIWSSKSTVLILNITLN